MGRNILYISILVAVTVIILGYVFTQNMSSHDTKIIKLLNSTSDERWVDTHPFGQNTRISSTLPEKENMGRITSLPNKCLGSALCPD